MLPQCSHITRKRGIYYYRRRLPTPFAGEIALSLRTRNFLRAEWLASRLEPAFRRVLQIMPESSKRADITRIVQKYLEQSLQHDWTSRTEAAHRPVYTVYADQREDPVAADLAFIDTELETAKTELAQRLYDHQGPLIEELMDKHQVPPEQRNELAFALFRANVEKWQTIRKRTLGDWDALGVPAPSVGANGYALPEAAKPVRQARTFSELLPDFIKLMQQNEGWRGQTLVQNQATYRMFIECCGDREVDQYQRLDLAKFYDTLRALPKLYAKSREWRGLPLVEIVTQTKDRDLTRLTMRTVKRHFTALGRIFSYFKSRGEITGENPAYGFEFPKQGRARQKRSMWSGENLKKLFASPVWTGCYSETRRSQPGALIIKDDKYWLPLLGVYHGNRLEEFAQLLRNDVRQQDGFWFWISTTMATSRSRTSSRSGVCRCIPSCCA